MSGELTIFEQREVLGVDFKIYGSCEEPLFLAKDVANWIGHSDTSTMVRNIDEDEKVTNNVCTLGGIQNALFLTEDGLYEVLMQSRKPIAKEFKKKVKEILKDIRKTGGYVGNEDLFIQTYLPFADENTKLLFKSTLEVIKSQNEVIEVMKPKAEFHDAVVGSSDTVDMGQVAKVLNMGVGRNTLFEILREKKILRRNNEPYQDYIDNGWFRLVESRYQKPNGDTCINLKTVVFQKGVDGIRKILQNLE